MLTYPGIDPVAIHLGPLKIHWYGIMYLIGFGAAWYLGRKRAHSLSSGWQASEIGDLIFFSALGVILGGRLGYALFYNFETYIRSPLEIFKIWEGGMSFHGGLLGVIVALWIYGRKTNRSVLQGTDFCAPLVPIGLGAGRIGNFINGELWGRVSNAPWAMVFPDPRAGMLARHPSQLYEAFLEGLVLFLLVWFFSRHPRPVGSVSGIFLIAYGIFRIFIEFFRVPDAQLGYLAFGWLTMGQTLSVPMILGGTLLVWWSYRNDREGTG